MDQYNAALIVFVIKQVSINSTKSATSVNLKDNYNEVGSGSAGRVKTG